MAVRNRSVVVLFILLLIVSVGVVRAEQAEKAVPKTVHGKQAAAAPAPAPIVDQRALTILKQMSDTLAKANSLSFKAFSTVPIKGPNGVWISLIETSRVVRQGSDNLYVETRGDVFPDDYYFNGKTVTRYAPSNNVYTEKAASGTVDAVIEQEYKDNGKSFPSADILTSNPYDILTDELIDALYVGQSTIGGVKTDHIVVTNEEVDWQIWIGTEDHMPRIISATYFEDISEPSSTIEFSDWKINEPVPDGTFTFNNASKAAKIEFRNPE